MTTINGTTYRLDFVIAGTGYSGDLRIAAGTARFRRPDPAVA